jgi:hypothetical protein
MSRASLKLRPVTWPRVLLYFMKFRKTDGGAQFKPSRKSMKQTFKPNTKKPPRGGYFVIRRDLRLARQVPY